MAAVMLGMMVQSTPVSFGAVGTPILIGVNKGLDSAGISTQLQNLTNRKKAQRRRIRREEKDIMYQYLSAEYCPF